MKNCRVQSKHLEEFNTYIENNSNLIVNYGEKWRYGETISTAFVESTINEVGVNLHKRRNFPFAL